MWFPNLNHYSSLLTQVKIKLPLHLTNITHEFMMLWPSYVSHFKEVQQFSDFWQTLLDVFQPLSQAAIPMSELNTH